MKKNKRKNRSHDTAKVLDAKSPFAVSEGFNQLRTNLMYATPADDACPVYAITSVREASGKSTVMANLAVSFSQIGKRVLLIDGDMRCPTIYNYFSLEKRRKGLSELLSGIETEEVATEVRPNLFVITSGRIPPNPSELLSSPKMKELLAEWKQTYDAIFLDFPPMGVVSDCVILSDEITGYIFTIHSGSDQANSVLFTIDAMEQIGAKILGTVLNDFDPKASSSYSSYNYRSRYSTYYASSYVKQAADLQKSLEAEEKKEKKDQK
ncbi:MAG: CpsD/CapB family tyrosine-protein kinase [Clostridia bacterium]|nr:CpsD/CapB family tyrosine-protein kinase [Clostridia bacterium]